MKYEDLSFTTIDENGVELVNDITKIIPNNNNSDEPYVVFTDYTLDSNDEFIEKYGKLIQKDNSYYIETSISKIEMEYINNMLKDEIVKYVNDTIEENIHD